MLYNPEQVMTPKDWAYLAISVIISTGLWVWVWREYQKPIVDLSWYTSNVSAGGHDYEDAIEY